jgi:putative transposase
MSVANVEHLRSETRFDILRSMYWNGAHTKHKVMYHIVWLPKYRKRVLKGMLAKRVKELLEECAEVNGWRIDELSIQQDHVHMLAQLRPDISISKVVQLFKGKSSRILRKEFPSLAEFYWGDSFWNDGFFVETVGKVSLEKIREYIKNQ